MRFRTPEGTSTCFFSPVERLSVAFLLNWAKRVAIAVQFADSISDPGLDKSFTSLRRSDAPRMAAQRPSLYHLVNDKTPDQVYIGLADT
jgi:hypothetical protein